jgi:hypothetical protein
MMISYHERVVRDFPNNSVVENNKKRSTWSSGVDSSTGWIVQVAGLYKYLYIHFDSLTDL